MQLKAGGRISDLLGLALLPRLALLRAEQLLLQVAERFGEVWPVAGETGLRAFDPTDFRRRGRHLCLGWTLLRQRDPFDTFGFGSQRVLLNRLLLLLLRSEGRSDAVAPLLFQIDRILFVDTFLFFLRRVGTGDVEGAVLHEII